MSSAKVKPLFNKHYGEGERIEAARVVPVDGGLVVELRDRDATGGERWSEWPSSPAGFSRVDLLLAYAESTRDADALLTIVRELARCQPTTAC